MRVLIVEDEPLAQSALANILAASPQVQEFDMAHDAVQAIEKILLTDFDVVLLDINMPEVSGIELLDQIKSNGRLLPAIIFVTAYAQHAVVAFEKHALDYVLKPYSRERIEEALDVAFRRTAGEKAIRIVESLQHLERFRGKQPTRIAIKANGRILFIDPDDVITVQAEGNYVLFQREAGSYLLRESLATMEEKLRPYGFIRIHRSTLVNRACVEEIEPLATGEYCLRMRNRKEYTVTRTYKKNLREISCSWIGLKGSFER